MEFSTINHYNESQKDHKIEISDYSKDELNIINNIIKTDKVIHFDDCDNSNILMSIGIYFYNLFCNYLNTRQNFVNPGDDINYFRNTKKYFKKAIRLGNKKALLKYANLLAEKAKKSNKNSLFSFSNSNNFFSAIKSGEEHSLNKKANKYFIQAIQNNIPSALLEYALFLKSINKVEKADVYFQKALQKEENKFDVLLEYAIFLDFSFISKDINKINEIYKNIENIENLTDEQKKKFYFNYIVFLNSIGNKEKYLECIEKGFQINSIDCIRDYIEIYVDNNNLEFLSAEDFSKLERYNLKLIELDNYELCNFYAQLLQIKKRPSEEIIHYYELGIQKINCPSCMNNLAVYYLTNNYQNLDKIENLFLDTIYLGEKSEVSNLYKFYKTYHSDEKATNFIRSFFSECKYEIYTNIETRREITCSFINEFINIKNINNLEKYSKLKKAIDSIQLNVDDYDNTLKEMENNDIHIKIYNIKKKIKKRYYQCDICYERKKCIPSNCFSDHYICYDCYFIQYDKPCHMCRYYNQDFNSVYIIAKNLIERIAKLDESYECLKLENAHLTIDIKKLKK